MDQEPKAYYRPDELAKELRVSSRTVYYWIKRGQLQAIGVGGRWRIPSHEFRRALRRGIALFSRVALFSLYFAGGY